MPESRSFKDLSITFAKNPITNDLMVVKDFVAIKKSVENLLTTYPGERFFNPNIGSRITQLLFEPLDFINATSIREEIEYTINAFEPRVLLNSVSVDINDSDDGYDVEIDYSIVGLPEKTDSITLFLERTRVYWHIIS
jgi:phage baseplate assembly protein W